MKILALSDSHGNVSGMVRAVELVSPQRIVHLGDCWRDAEELHGLFPDIPLDQIPGNCDYRPGEPLEKLLFWEECRVLICHGHTYGVKQSLIRAGYTAQTENLDLFLFGHTHSALLDRRGKTWFLNPGSIGDRNAYAVVEINGCDVRATLCRLEDIR